MELIDRSELERDTEWNVSFDGYVSYSSKQIQNAPIVEAVPLDKVKKAIDEIQELRDCSYSCSDGIINDVEDILYKLLESEVEA